MSGTVIKSVKRAKVLDEESIADALAWIEAHSRWPLRDRLMILLTCRIGLRAQEVAMLHPTDFLTARGEIGPVFYVSARGAKNGRARTLPMHAEVRAALQEYLDTYKCDLDKPMFFDQFGKALTPNAVYHQTKRVYTNIGLVGCTSHSGRRTFGTTLARRAGNIGASLRDVQMLMGHRFLSTTETYIDPTDLQASLVASLGQASSH